LSQSQPAIDYLNRALAIFLRIDDGHDQAVTLNNLGNLYRSMSNWKQALATSTRLCLSSTTRRSGWRGQILANTATVYRHLGQPQKP